LAATQQIYLGLPSFLSWRRSLEEKKMKRLKRGLDESGITQARASG
jgi:hypothetical protein